METIQKLIRSAEEDLSAISGRLMKTKNTGPVPSWMFSGMKVSATVIFPRLPVTDMMISDVIPWSGFMPVFSIQKQP